MPAPFPTPTSSLTPPPKPGRAQGKGGCSEAPAAWGASNPSQAQLAQPIRPGLGTKSGDKCPPPPLWPSLNCAHPPTEHSETEIRALG